jgi:hypothetical protein
MTGVLAEGVEEISHLFLRALSAWNTFRGIVINAIPWTMLFIPEFIAVQITFDSVESHSIIEVDPLPI